MAFTESFTGAANTDLAALGTGWTRVDGSSGMAAINASNQLKCTTTDTNGAAYTAPDCGTADHYAQSVFRGATGAFHACVRVVDRSNFIGARGYVTSFDCYKKVSGSFTLVGTYASTPSSGDTVKIEISGTSVTVYVNSISRITGTVSDAVFSGVTTCGLVARNAAADPWTDDWESTQTGGGGPVISYFSAIAGAGAGTGGMSARSNAIASSIGAVGASSGQKSISLGISIIAGAVGSASGTKAASAGISAIAGLLGALETMLPGTAQWNAIAGALVSVTHSTARLSTIEAKMGARADMVGVHQAVRALQAIAGSVASIQGPPDDDRTSTFQALAGAAIALSKTTARIASIVASAGVIGANVATSIRAAQISAIAGLRAALHAINPETTGALLTVAVSAQAAYVCSISAQAAYNCMLTEAILQ